MIAILDYGIGNLRSVAKAVEFTGGESLITSDKKLIDKSTHIILPGVGAFNNAMTSLKYSDLAEILLNNIKKGKPVLGICLGMQMLFDSSSEGGVQEGLGVLKGDILKFDNRLKVPHVGWNEVSVLNNSKLYNGISDSHFYFVHSYYLPKTAPSASGITSYGIDFAASCECNNVYGVQFHPEKSGESGLRMLKNFGGIK